MVAIPPKPPTKTTQATTTPETYRQTPHHQPSQQTQATTRGRNRATEQPRGGFATIDPRHAGDTPQGSAYGSNSPHRAQASTRAPPNQSKSRTQNLPKRPETTPPPPTPQQDTKTIQLSCQGCAQRTQSVGVAVGLGEGPRPFPPVPVIMTRLQSWEATSSSTWKPSSAESNWA